MKNSSKFVIEGYLHILSIFIIFIIAILSGEMNLRFYNVMCGCHFLKSPLLAVKTLQSFSTFVMVFGSEFIL